MLILTEFDILGGLHGKLNVAIADDNEVMRDLLEEW